MPNVYSDEEIRKLYRDSSRSERQIKILQELTFCMRFWNEKDID